jgi:hypothetical protein
MENSHGKASDAAAVAVKAATNRPPSTLGGGGKADKVKRDVKEFLLEVALVSRNFLPSPSIYSRLAVQTC